MEPLTRAEVTSLLEQIGSGDTEAEAQLTPTIYGELRSLAGSYLRRERQGHTLQPTDLVHEAYMRLVGSGPATDRNHFYALTARTMRNVLVDHARRKQAAKRGSPKDQITLSTALFAVDQPEVEVLDLDRALTRLVQINERAAKLVELRYFGGLTCEEAAEVLKISLTSAERSWRTARAWLRRELAK